MAAKKPTRRSFTWDGPPVPRPYRGTFEGSGRVKAASKFYSRFTVSDVDGRECHCDVGDFVHCQATDNKVRPCML